MNNYVEDLQKSFEELNQNYFKICKLNNNYNLNIEIKVFENEMQLFANQINNYFSRYENLSPEEKEKEYNKLKNTYNNFSDYYQNILEIVKEIKKGNKKVETKLKEMNEKIKSKHILIGIIFGLLSFTFILTIILVPILPSDAIGIAVGFFTIGIITIVILTFVAIYEDNEADKIEKEIDNIKFYYAIQFKNEMYNIINQKNNAIIVALTE